MNKTIVCPDCNGRGLIPVVGEDYYLSKMCDRCHGDSLISVPMTNGDKLRAMNDAELARWICKGAHYSDSACSYCKHNKEKTCTGQECQNKSDEDIIREWLMEVVED